MTCTNAGISRVPSATFYSSYRRYRARAIKCKASWMTSSSYLRRVEEALAAIRAQNRYREIPDAQHRFVADFSTNDYLALAADSRMVEAMRHVKRVGSGGARLLGGNHREHALLEADVARWLERESALLFSSGYMAALGAIPALATLVRAIYSDALNHASLIDGIRAAKVPCDVFAHTALPPKAARAHPALIVTESLFGMDGDTVDVPALVEDLNVDDILLVDEAHALGVFGAHGAGDERVLILGTLGKAIGAAGGFIAGPASVIELLVNRARTFVFDTAPPPAIAFAARVGIMLGRGAEDRRARLFANAARLRAGLRELGVFGREDGFANAMQSPIVPVIAGDEQRAIELMQRCAKRGLNVPAIRPPTVPPGTSRLRISVRADHTDEHLALLLEQLACCTAFS